MEPIKMNQVLVNFQQEKTHRQGPFDKVKLNDSRFAVISRYIFKDSVRLDFSNRTLVVLAPVIGVRNVTIRAASAFVMAGVNSLAGKVSFAVEGKFVVFGDITKLNRAGEWQGNPFISINRVDTQRMVQQTKADYQKLSTTDNPAALITRLFRHIANYCVGFSYRYLLEEEALNEKVKVEEVVELAQLVQPYHVHPSLEEWSENERKLRALAPKFLGVQHNDEVFYSLHSENFRGIHNALETPREKDRREEIDTLERLKSAHTLTEKIHFSLKVKAMSDEKHRAAQELLTNLEEIAPLATAPSKGGVFAGRNGESLLSKGYKLAEEMNEEIAKLNLAYLRAAADIKTSLACLSGRVSR